MFGLDIKQTEWLLLAIGVGVVGALVTWLALWTAWDRPRPGDSGEQDLAAEADASDRPAVPWLLIGLYAAIALFVIVYTIRMALNPPTWW